MKKILFALFVGAMALVSCTKEGGEATKSSVRQFTYKMGGQSMYSRSVVTDDVLQAINATLPESINIYLTSQTTGKMFTGKTGEGIVLPSDLYKVIGSANGSPASIGEITSIRRSFLATTPQVEVEQNITITDDVTDYTLQGKYKSFALVVDDEEVAKATVTTKNGEEAIPFITSGDSRLIFAQGDFSNYLFVTVYPKDTERYDVTKFTLATTPTSGTSLVENGKFYVLHPTARGQQPKIIGLDIPSFVQGTI